MNAVHGNVSALVDFIGKEGRVRRHFLLHFLFGHDGLVVITAAIVNEDPSGILVGHKLQR